MSNQDFQPNSTDPAKQHFVDASLEEFTRLGNQADTNFLEQMDSLLDEVDHQTNLESSRITRMPSRTKRTLQNRIFWISATGAALLFFGLFAIQHLSKKVRLDTSAPELANVEIKDRPNHSTEMEETGSQPGSQTISGKIISRAEKKDTDAYFADSRNTRSSLGSGAPGEKLKDLNQSAGEEDETLPANATPEPSNIRFENSSNSLRQVNGSAQPFAESPAPPKNSPLPVSPSASGPTKSTDSPMVSAQPVPRADITRRKSSPSKPKQTDTSSLDLAGVMKSTPPSSTPVDTIASGNTNGIGYAGRAGNPVSESKIDGVIPKYRVAKSEALKERDATPFQLGRNNHKSTSTVAAMVNGTTITTDNVNEALRKKVQLHLFSQDGQVNEQQTMTLIREMEETALHQVIDEKLILGEFKKRGGKVDPKYVDQTVNQIVEKRFGGNEKDFAATLAKNNITLEAFRQVQADQIAVQTMLGRQDGGNNATKRNKQPTEQEYRVLITKLRKDANIQIVPQPSPKPAPRGERYGQLIDNPFASPLKDPLSTFSVDVDTASYSNIRRLIREGHSVPADSVRIEEMINYFSYDYPQPEEKHPFAFAIETAQCPWNENHQLMRVGIQGKKMNRDQRPPANLVFLLDVSGSMSPANKLPLVKKSMGLLIEELTEHDTISIVVYAGAEGLCLSPTNGNQKKKILDALDNLNAGGSTNGGAGIQLAYKLARENFKENGLNRVILCTDGDFNVGKTEQGDLVSLVEKRAKSGTFLSVLGFGSGNINDSMLEAITNKGNGNYFYIDSLKEGRKVLLQDLMSTLVTIAKDVKIQVEFNPKHVQHYRLIGYANRILKAEDFTNDKVDAGEIGAGHSVTALYEIVPAGAPPIQQLMSSLRYQQPVKPEPVKMKLIESDELCLLKLRYKLPDGNKSIPMEQPVNYKTREWQDASDDYQFASAVALWGMLLRDSEFAGQGNWKHVLELAKDGMGADPFGRRAELIKLLNENRHSVE